MAVCTWTLLNEPWDALGTWTGGDTNGAVSSISPAGQLYFDCRAMSAIGYAQRYKDIGALGTGNYTFYIRFKGDVWDKISASSIGMVIETHGETYRLVCQFGNGHTNGDGIYVFDGDAWVKVLAKTWDNDWHTLRFDVHNSQTDVDIYVDDEASPSVTDADCTYATDVNGKVMITGYGSVAGDGEYHIDFIKINDGLCDPTETEGGSKRLLRGHGI